MASSWIVNQSPTVKWKCSRIIFLFVLEIWKLVSDWLRCWDCLNQNLENQMWLHRSQLWNIKLGRVQHITWHMCLELWGKKLPENTTTCFWAKVILREMRSFRHFDVIASFSINLWRSIMRYLGNEWSRIINKESQYCRGDDPMMTWSLLVWRIKWQDDPGVWDDGTKVISCERAVIIKQSSEGLHRGLSVNLFRICPWMGNG